MSEVVKYWSKKENMSKDRFSYESGLTCFVEKSELDEAQREIERLKWEHERDCAGQVQVIDELNEKLATANALLDKALVALRFYGANDFPYKGALARETLKQITEARGKA